jgi:serine/threonine protein kinase
MHESNPWIAEVSNIAFIPKHINIVKYYGWFQFQGCIIVGMEWCQGKLTEFISRLYGSYNPHQQRCARWDMVQNISSALHECHLIGMMHRDIKPENSDPLHTI